MGAKKVEDLIVIKENKEQIKDFKAKSTYKLRKVQEQSFDKISVDLILARLVSDRADDLFENSDSENENDAEVLCVNGESDVDSEVDNSSDIEEI